MPKSLLPPQKPRTAFAGALHLNLLHGLAFCHPPPSLSSLRGGAGDAIPRNLGSQPPTNYSIVKDQCCNQRHHQVSRVLPRPLRRPLSHACPARKQPNQTHLNARVIVIRLQACPAFAGARGAQPPVTLGRNRPPTIQLSKINAVTSVAVQPP